MKGAYPQLFPWNNWSVEGRKRREIIRSFPRESSPIRDNSGSVCSIDLDISEIQNTDLNLQESSLQIELEELNKLHKENAELIQENKYLKLENKELKEKLHQYEENTKVIREKFVNHVIENDENCAHYTGFTSVTRLKETFEYCKPGENGENMRMPTSAKEKTKQGRPRALSPFEGYVLTLCKLRQNFSFEHLCFLLQIALSTGSKTFLMWITFLYLRLGSVSIWPTQETVRAAMPDSMKEKFPNVRIILDCTEIFVESPSKLQLHKMFYSDYKSHVTLKILLGIMPGGGFTFISSCFVGSISDRDICIKSGLLTKELWDKGDAVMVDRGFTIGDLLEPLGVELIMPSFLAGRDQLTTEETILSQQIAAERIHVERMIQRFKNFRIFDSSIPITMFGQINEIVTVCALLCNMQDPIIAAQNQ